MGVFYKRLKEHLYISITGLRGSETMNSVAVTIDGKVEEVDNTYPNKIYATHPEMKDVDASDERSSRNASRPVTITPIRGSVYDLRQKRCLQNTLNFSCTIEEPFIKEIRQH